MHLRPRLLGFSFFTYLDFLFLISSSVRFFFGLPGRLFWGSSSSTFSTLDGISIFGGLTNFGYWSGSCYFVFIFFIIWGRLYSSFFTPLYYVGKVLNLSNLPYGNPFSAEFIFKGPTTELGTYLKFLKSLLNYSSKLLGFCLKAESLLWMLKALRWEFLVLYSYSSYCKFLGPEDDDVDNNEAPKPGFILKTFDLSVPNGTPTIESNLNPE